MWTMLSPSSKQSHGCSCQGSKATNHTGTLRNLPNRASGTYTNTHRNSSEPSGTFRTLPPEPTPTRAGRNSPEPSGTFRDLSEPTFQNLPTPAYAGTLRNLPELASGTYTILHRNSPEPSGTCLRNLHHHTPELSGTFRNLPEPPSGTCSCDPHRHTPEPIWAEDPISLRCWGIGFGGIPITAVTYNYSIYIHIRIHKSLRHV